MALFPTLTRLVLTRFRKVFALRHQILVLQYQICRPQFTDTDQTILAVLAASRGWKIPRAAGIDPTRDRAGP